MVLLGRLGQDHTMKGSLEAAGASAISLHLLPALLPFLPLHSSYLICRSPSCHPHRFPARSLSPRLLFPGRSLPSSSPLSPISAVLPDFPSFLPAPRLHYLLAALRLVRSHSALVPVFPSPSTVLPMASLPPLSAPLSTLTPPSLLAPPSSASALHPRISYQSLHPSPSCPGQLLSLGSSYCLPCPLAPLPLCPSLSSPPPPAPLLRSSFLSLSLSVPWRPSRRPRRHRSPFRRVRRWANTDD